MKETKLFKNIKNIIEALSKHEDSSAIEVLEKLGTNCDNDEIRSLTAKALIEKNTPESLSIVILNKGKGINDLNTGVAMNTINDLLALKDKNNMTKILDDAIQANIDEEIKETALSVKALMALS